MLTDMELNFEGLEIQQWKKMAQRSFWVLSGNGLDHRFWSYRLWDIESRNIKKLLSQQKIMELCNFKGWCLASGSSESSNPQYFLKKLNKIFQMHVNILSKLWLIFYWHQQKIQKLSHFWRFNDHNSGEYKW